MEEYIVDFSGVTDIESFHACLKKSLPLPEWYGGNLDALFDSLTDLDEACIYFRNCVQAAESIADYYDSFLNVISDAQMEAPGLFCFFENSGGKGALPEDGEDEDSGFGTGDDDFDGETRDNDDLDWETGGDDDPDGETGDNDDLDGETGGDDAPDEETGDNDDL